MYVVYDYSTISPSRCMKSAMAINRKIPILFISIITVLIGKFIYQHTRSLNLPNLPVNQFWGDDDATAANETLKKLQLVRPFYGLDEIDEISDRLDNVILPEPLEDANFEYGFNAKYLKEILNYWKNDYLPRWREREIFIWSFPHYTTFVQGLRMHYLHLKVYDDVKVNKTMYPILLLHGWPSSVREFYNIAPKLYEGGSESDIVFDIVIPSLPGFAWSQGTSKRGLGPAQMAVILRNLMLQIGYKKFFIHGNDWGSVIGSNMATLFPENVLGYHSSMCTVYTILSGIKRNLASLAPSLFVDYEFKDIFFPISKPITSLIEETGFFHLQMTKPDTIGTCLSYNPPGLAAYILEKFSTWTNSSYKTRPDGGLTKRYKMDTLIDNVMIYYLTNSITTSQRLYAEAVSKEQLDLNLDRVPTYVPTGCARFKGGLPHHNTLDFQLKDKYKNLIHSTYYNKGGHFAALEQPSTLYNDIITFVKKAEKFIT